MEARRSLAKSRPPVLFRCMTGRARTLFAGLALLGAGCNLGSGLDPITGESTTSTTTTVLDPAATSTTVTLPPAEDAETAIVIAVVDGDSFIANVDGAEFDVRLLGVNAPESDECAGDDSRTALTNLLAESNVVMVAGEEDTDDFDRLLRYVYVEGEDGTALVNRQLVADGFAVGLQSGHDFEAEFKDLERRAYASGKGMWGTFVCGQPDGLFPDRPQVRVASVTADPSGPDGDSLDAEMIEIVNNGYGTVSLAGWLVRDESSSNRLTLPAGTGINPGGTLTVVTGCGTAGSGTVYWCSDTPVWSNDGDTVILADPRGNVVHRLVYGPTDG